MTLQWSSYRITKSNTKVCKRSFPSYNFVCSTKISRLFSHWLNCTARIFSLSQYGTFIIAKARIWICFTAYVESIRMTKTNALLVITKSVMKALKKVWNWFKVNNWTPEQRYWRLSGMFIINFEHISLLLSVSYSDLTGPYLFKINSRNTRRTICESCKWRRSFKSFWLTLNVFTLTPYLEVEKSAPCTLTI